MNRTLHGPSWAPRISEFTNPTRERGWQWNPPGVAPSLARRVSVCECVVVVAAALSLGLHAAHAADAAPSDDDLRINQLQYIGTHNSYHIREPKAKGGAQEWNYSHAPLDVQLDRGVRSFELDLHFKNGEFEVFHVPILDEGTTCRKLSDALATVRKWSDAHPRHLPISFLFELKKEGPGLDRRIKEVDAAGLDHLDEVLRAGFADDRRIAPDQVRGSAATLRRGRAHRRLAHAGRRSRPGAVHPARRRQGSRAVYRRPPLAARPGHVRPLE